MPEAVAVPAAAYFAASGKPTYGLAAALFALSTYGLVAEARETAAQVRSPQTASDASLEEPTTWEAAGGDALEGVGKVATSGGGGLLETAAGFASKLIDGLWRRTKPRRVARWQATISANLQAAERTLVSCRAVLVPHGPRRMLVFLTFLLAWPWMAKGGFLTVTDQRLLFHRRSRLGRRREPYVHLSVPLTELEVLEWYEGWYSETRRHVLIMRIPDGRAMRLNIDRVWAEEAQSVFDVVASSSKRPPAFLAARWTLSPGTATAA